LNTIRERSGKSGDAANVAILLTIALCIGVYLIITSALIAKDGIQFIRYATRFETAPMDTLLRRAQAPGYPALILTAHNLVNLVYPDHSNLGWIYCGQSVSLVFRLLTVIMLYFTGKRLVGPKLSFWAC